MLKHDYDLGMEYHQKMHVLKFGPNTAVFRGGVCGKGWDQEGSDKSNGY